jgi:hypothetical protein
MFAILRNKPSLPNVFSLSADPVEAGIVQSYARPGRDQHSAVGVPARDGPRAMTAPQAFSGIDAPKTLVHAQRR